MWCEVIIYRVEGRKTWERTSVDLKSSNGGSTAQESVSARSTILFSTPLQTPQFRRWKVWQQRDLVSLIFSIKIPNLKFSATFSNFLLLLPINGSQQQTYFTYFIKYTIYHITKDVELREKLDCDGRGTWTRFGMCAVLMWWCICIRKCCVYIKYKYSWKTKILEDFIIIYY